MDGLLPQSDQADLVFGSRLELLVGGLTRKRGDARYEQSGDRLNLQLDFSMDFLDLASNKSAMAQWNHHLRILSNESACIFPFKALALR
jgi:hypothetical protein